MENKQLFEKQGSNHNPFFPIVRLEDIIDKTSDKSIQWILNTYNHIYVEYSESAAITRNKVPALLRRTGLWITYNVNKEIITEYYKGDNKDVQNYLQWTMNDNWERFDKIKHLNGSIEYQHLSETLKELMGNGNTITNFPDDEDLEVRKGVLKFKDKEYDTDNFSGLGRVILRKNLNIINNKANNVLTQSMINKSNTIYIIQYDYDLRGEEITIPEGCVLDFQGGSFSNGGIIFKGTKINSFNRAFKNCIFNGTILGNVNISWAADGDDITEALQQFGNVVKGVINIDIHNPIISSEVVINNSDFVIDGCNNQITFTTKSSTIQIGENKQDLAVYDVIPYDAYFNTADVDFTHICQKTNDEFVLFHSDYEILDLNKITDANGVELQSGIDYELSTYNVDNSYGFSETLYKIVKFINGVVGAKYIINVNAIKRLTNQQYFYTKDISNLKKGKKIIVASNKEFASLARPYYKKGELLRVQSVSDTKNSDGNYTVYLDDILSYVYRDTANIYIAKDGVFCNNVALRNVIIDGQFICDNIIIFNNIDNLHIESCKFKNGRAYGVLVNSCIDVFVSNSYFDEAIYKDGKNPDYNYTFITAGSSKVSIVNSHFNGGRHSFDCGVFYLNEFFSSSNMTEQICSVSKRINLTNCQFGSNSIKEVFNVVKATVVSHVAADLNFSNCSIVGGDCSISANNINIDGCSFSRTAHIGARKSNISNSRFNNLALSGQGEYNISNCKINEEINGSGTSKSVDTISSRMVNANGMDVRNVYFDNATSVQINNSRINFVGIYNYADIVEISNCSVNEGIYIQKVCQKNYFANNIIGDSKEFHVVTHAIYFNAVHSVVKGNYIFNTAISNNNISAALKGVIANSTTNFKTLIVTDNTIVDSIITTDANMVRRGISINESQENEVEAIVLNNNILFNKKNSNGTIIELSYVEDGVRSNHIPSWLFSRNNYAHYKEIPMGTYYLFPAIENEGFNNIKYFDANKQRQVYKNNDKWYTYDGNENDMKRSGKFENAPADAQVGTIYFCNDKPTTGTWGTPIFKREDYWVYYDGTKVE